MHTKNAEEAKKFVEDNAENANTMVTLARRLDGKIEIHVSGDLMDLALLTLALQTFSTQKLLKGE